MEQSPDVNTRFHLKMGLIMSIFLLVDSTMWISAINHTMASGPSMQIVFGFEVANQVTKVCPLDFQSSINSSQVCASRH